MYKLKAAEWLLEVVAKPEVADTRPLFLIHHPDLLNEFDTRLNGYRAVALVSIHNDSCEYVNTPKCSKRAVSMKSSKLSKHSSVSPGKPTITSTPMAQCGIRVLISCTRSAYNSRL